MLPPCGRRLNFVIDHIERPSPD